MNIYRNVALALTLSGLLVCSEAQTPSDQKKKDSGKPLGSTAQLSDPTARKAPANGQTAPSSIKTKNTNMTDVYVFKTNNSSATQSGTPQPGTPQPGQIQDQAINANPGPRHRPGTPANNHKNAAPAAPQHGQPPAPEPKR